MDKLTSILDFIRWIIAVPLLAISMYFIVTNFRFLLESFRLGLNAGPAPMTIMGGLSGVLGLLFLPYMEFSDRLALLWLPLVLDLGSLPFYVSMLILFLSQRLGIRLWKKHPDYQSRGNS
jgi:hypothetical protein